MEKWIGIVVLMSSAVLLSVLLLKHTKYRISLKKVAVHWIVSALILFLLHSIKLTSGYAVPMTPLSLSIMALLGVPGLALMQGVYILV